MHTRTYILKVSSKCFCTLIKHFYYYYGKLPVGFPDRLVTGHAQRQPFTTPPALTISNENTELQKTLVYICVYI